jgi:hypothetical protein
MQFGDSVLKYHFNLQPDILLPPDVEWLLPYGDEETRRCMTAFYHNYYGDDKDRTFMLGINPGRFGGGMTGVPFTDPIRLDRIGIPNSFIKKQELSSVFIYDMIDACGGPADFYKQYYITSLSPLGLVKLGKNYNYYDDPALLRLLEPFIIDNINTQLTFGANRDVAYCLGQGKNIAVLSKLNEKHGWWNRVVPLPHPRWIMQYKLKSKDAFIQMYKEQLRP